MFGREPVIIAASIAALIQAGVIFVTGDLTVSTVSYESWLLPVVTVVGGLLGRRKVMPTATIEKAGLSPEAVKARAGE